MTITRPRLTRSVPFWTLLGGSVVSIGVGAYVLVDKLGIMATTLTDGTATGVEVYAGQIWAVLGAILVGSGLIGLALTATLTVLGSFVSVAPLDVSAAPVWGAADDSVTTVAASDDAPLTQSGGAHIDEAEAPLAR
ncbi:dinucleotide-utilizing enzyme [Microbacterium sp.]|uniref:dinucleotide-utilizing enzyme n=1 Tax=Microbacterium sp. TaxID=51671 RepID=UPI0025F392B8|nr:dinucleotide-utilizing enzyme [Microbacterium sp.]